MRMFSWRFFRVWQRHRDVFYVFHFNDSQVEGLPGRTRPATLEDVFFKLTGRSLVE